MTEIQLPLPLSELPSYEHSALPSYGEAIKLPSDYIKCPNDTYRLFTATKSGSPTPWAITEMVTTAPGTPPPPSGRNRVHPDTTIGIDDEEEYSKDKCRWRIWILLIFLGLIGCFSCLIFLSSWVPFSIIFKTSQSSMDHGLKRLALKTTHFGPVIFVLDHIHFM